ncbi:hypothetical protein STANM309S_05115 [Streptomyces tanashiensis]
MAPSTAPAVTLNNGVEIPQLGFGVFQVADDETTAGGRPRGRLPQHRHRRRLRRRGRRRAPSAPG